MFERKKVEKSMLPRWDQDPDLENMRLTPYQATGGAVLPSTFLGIYVNVLYPMPGGGS